MSLPTNSTRLRCSACGDWLDCVICGARVEITDELVAKAYRNLYGQNERMDDDLRQHIVDTLKAALLCE